MRPGIGSPEQLALVLARQGLFEEAERSAQDAIAVADEGGRLGSRAEARTTLAEIMRLEGKGLEAARLVEVAAALYESAGDRAGAARARTILADIRGRPNPGPETPDDQA